jgi:hypothetical protein
VSPSLVISTVAGKPPPVAAGFDFDNVLATNAKLNGPTGIIIDAALNWLIVDRGNQVIRRVVATTRVMSIVVGVTGAAGTHPFTPYSWHMLYDKQFFVLIVIVGYTGDGGPSLGARVSSPYHISFDQLTGGFFVAGQ